MAINEENILNMGDTSAQTGGGIPVSGPGDRERIQKARKQIYDSLNTKAFTFEEFNLELDDPEFGEGIVEKLSTSDKLTGWTPETLREAVFNGILPTPEEPVKSNEVSSQGSEAISETSPEPSQTSQSTETEPQGADSATVIPAVPITGTWREGFQGSFNYDGEGYENFVPTTEFVESMGGWDRLREYFINERPNVLLHEPLDTAGTDEASFAVEAFDPTRIVNYDTARPNNIEAIRKNQELEAKPFDEWDQNDKTDYFLSKIVQNNTQQGNSVSPQTLEEQRVREVAEADEENSSGFLGSFRDLVSSGVRAFGSGSARVASDALGVVPFLNDAIANLVNAPTFKETYGDTFLQDAQDVLKGAISRDELYNKIRFGDQGIVESFQSGNVEDGVNKLVSGITNSLPIMLSLSTGNAGTALTTLSMGAGQYEGLQESNPNMDQNMKLLNSTLNMYAEMIPERIGADAVFKPFYDLFKKSGREVAEQALAKTFRKYTGQFGALTPTAVEGMTEVATTGMQNIIAKYSGEDPERKITDNMADSFVVGAATGATIASPAQVANSVVNKANRDQVQTLATENRDIEVYLNNKELNPQVREALTEKYLTNVETINSYIEQEVERKGSLSEGQKAIVRDLESRKERMATLIENPEVSEAIQKGAQEDINKINEQIEVVLNENTQEGTSTSVESPEVQPVRTEVEPEAELVEEAPAGSVQESQEISETPEPAADTPSEEITAQPEVVEGLAQDVSFVERITNGEQRTSRLQELEARLRGNLQQDQNLGVTPDPREKARRDLEFVRDLTEYAVLKIADGTVKTAEAFQNLARGLGDFGDKVLNQAYYNAREFATEYANTNPQLENISQGTAEILQRMQDVSIDRTRPKTKVTSRTVKELTDKGTVGVLRQTIKKAQQEYYATLEKGAKIGSRSQKAAAKALAKQVKSIVTDRFKQAGVPISTAMTDRDVVRLSGKVASANNQKSLDDLIDFVDKLAEKSEYAKTFKDLSKLRDTAKKRAKSERLPANIREIFARFGSIGAGDLFNKGLLTPSNMQEAQSLIDRVLELNSNVRPGEQYKGNIANLTELNVDLKNFADKVERLNFNQDLPKLVEHLKALTSAAGGRFNAETDTPKTYRDYRLAVDALEATIAEQNLDEVVSKSNTRYKNELFVEQNLPLLDEVDLSEFTSNEQKVIQDMRDITPEVLAELSDADVVKLSIAIPNIVNNGRLDGIGSAVAKANAYALANDTGFTSSVKKATSSIPALAGIFTKIPGASARGYEKVATTFMSTSQRVDALFKDLFTKGKFMGRFGMQAYKEGRNDAQRLYEKAQKDFGEFATKDKDVSSFLRSKDRGVREVKLGIYAWLNQQEAGLTPEEKTALFQRKIETLQKMRKGIDPSSGDRFDWRELNDNKVYYDNVRTALDEMVSSRSIEDAASQLGKGEMKVYERALDMFDTLRPEFIANARLYNNIDLDTNVENYTPIDYKFFSDDANSALLDTSYDRAFSSTKISGRSGSKSAKDRIIKDGTLPKDGILDFNFITNVFKNYGLQLADIHTQGQRLQIHHNLMNNKLKSATGGVNFFYSINSMMTEEMQTSYNYYSTPRAMSLGRKLLRNLMTATYGKALGGPGQAIKQFIPMVLDAMARTGDMKTLGWYWGNAGKVAEFMSGQDIARRGVRASQMGASVTNDLDVGEISNKVMGSIDRILELQENFVNKVVLGPLRMGDVHGARISWMMYYNQYAENNNIPVDLDSKPNPEAAAFADNMVDITGNTSVDSNKAKFTQSTWARMFFPFSGTALTSLMNQSVNTSKLITAIQTKDRQAARQAVNAITANSLAILSFQMIGWGLRWASYMGLKSLASMAIDGIDLDDEDEEEGLVEDLHVVLDDYIKKRERRNFENSMYYITSDMLHRGLFSQGVMEAASDAIIKPVFQNVTGFTINKYRSANPNDAFYEMLGIYGIIPAGIESLMDKNSSLFKDEPAQMRDNGYGAFLQADGTYGFETLEGRQMPKKLRMFQKAMNVMSIPTVFGIQDQYTSSITRTMPALYKQMEKVVYKDVPKVSNIKDDKQFQNKFNTLNFQGRNMKLESAEQKLFKKAYTEAYKEEYSKYVERNEPLFGRGKKMEELAAKHIYKKAKEKLMQNEDFKKVWDLRSDKNKR